MGKKKGMTNERKRGKQPKPYWRWEENPDRPGWGRWVHPLLKAAAFGAAFALAPSIAKAALHFFFGDDIIGGIKEWGSDIAGGVKDWLSDT